KDDRHVLVPTDAVDLRVRGQDVWVKDLGAREVARLPAYRGGAVESIVMRRVADAFYDRGNDLRIGGRDRDNPARGREDLAREREDRVLVADERDRERRADIHGDPSPARETVRDETIFDEQR